MITPFDDKLLTAYAYPETVIEMLGIRNPEIGARIVRSRYLSGAIDLLLVPPMADIEIADQTKRGIVEAILASDLDRLRMVTRIIAVLTQSWHLSRSASGKVLRIAVAYSGESEIVDLIRYFDLPILESLPPVKDLDEKSLDDIAEMALSYLVGLVPQPLLMRYAFMFPTAGFPVPLELEDRAADREVFVALAATAFTMLDEREEKNASSDTAHATH